MISVYGEAVSRMRAKSAGGAHPGISGGGACPGVSRGSARPGVSGGGARSGVWGFVLVLRLVSVIVVAAGCGGGSAAPVSTAFRGAAGPAGSCADPDGDLGDSRGG